MDLSCDNESMLAQISALRYADQRMVFDTFGRRILDSDLASGPESALCSRLKRSNEKQHLSTLRIILQSEAWEGYHCCLFAYGGDPRIG